VLLAPTSRRRAVVALSVTTALIAAAPATAAPSSSAAWLPFTAPGLTARAATPPPAMPSAAAGTLFAGSVSPFDAPIVLQRARKRVTQVTTAYDTSCFFYANVIRTSRLRKAAIDRKGRFAFSVRTSLVDSPSIYWSGERYPDQIVERFTGKFTKSGAKGTLRATVSFLDGSTCTTGQQRFVVARRPARVFGGVTSQSMPVTVELSASGQRVNHLHIAWAAPCSNGGAWVLADFLTNFALTGGAVDETFEQSYPTSDGGLFKYAYRLAMRVANRNLTGTLEVTVTVTDAAGATEAVCTAPTVRWSAGS
jgi:hypothetical protein